MDFKNLFDDDRAVSPVIGVILMVAITVILAAVIGTFVLGLGDQVQQTTPTASFGFETGAIDNTDANDEITVTLESGDSIDSSALKVSVGGTAYFDNGATAGSGVTYPTDTWSGNTISAGSTLTIKENSDLWDGETDVRVTYSEPGSDKSATLATHTFDAEE